MNVFAELSFSQKIAAIIVGVFSVLVVYTVEAAIIASFSSDPFWYIFGVVAIGSLVTWGATYKYEPGTLKYRTTESVVFLTCLGFLGTPGIVFGLVLMAIFYPITYWMKKKLSNM